MPLPPSSLPKVACLKNHTFSTKNQVFTPTTTCLYQPPPAANEKGLGHWYVSHLIFLLTIFLDNIELLTTCHQ